MKIGIRKMKHKLHKLEEGMWSGISNNWVDFRASVYINEKYYDDLHYPIVFGFDIKDNEIKNFYSTIRNYMKEKIQKEMEEK